MIGSEAGRPIEILLVEDDPGDIKLARVALRENKFQNNLNVVNDGVDALAYLRRANGYAQAARPDLILLDLNLPRMDGRALLKEIKSDATLRNIPVVVLTTSKAEEDIVKAYDLYVNCYVTKPLGLEQFMSIVQSIQHFWLSIVQLPARG